MTGRVFEIREFCLHDGPGIRTTVFLKGCPLRCRWCHNPEGQAFVQETLVHRDGRRTTCGVDWEPGALAGELLANADIMVSSGGGITFSGGEPLAQANFVLAVIAELRTRAKIGVALETSGFADEATYRRVVAQMDFVYQDLKLPTAEGYACWCGCDAAAAEVVFSNIAWLKTSSVPHAFRVPQIPEVNTDDVTRKGIADIIGESSAEYLPYNPAAGAKYPLLGRVYELCTDYKSLILRTGRP